MVQRAMKFTPEVLLSAPRRSTGVPNASGTKVLYTTSTYSFKTHSKECELRVLDVATGDSQQLECDDEVSDLNWLDDDKFVCLRANKDSTTTVCVASACAGLKSSQHGDTYHEAGKIDGSAGNLRIAKLDSKGHEFAVVVSAQANPDGTLYNSAKAKKTQSTGRLYSSLYVVHWDQFEGKQKNALWYGKLSKSHHDKFTLSKLTNALQGTGLASPVEPFGGTDNFDVSNNSIIFVAKDPELDQALNTKSNVYLVRPKSWDHGQSSPLVQQVVISGFEGASTCPCFNHDGTVAAFLSMKGAGYEADKNQIFVLQIPKGEQELAAVRAFSTDGGPDGSWDRSPSSVCFTSDSKHLLAIAEEHGFARLFLLNTIFPKEHPRALTTVGSVSDMKCLSSGHIFISGSSIVDNSFYAIVDPHMPPPASAGSSPSLTTWVSSNSGMGSKFGLKPEQVNSIWTPASNTKINGEVHSFVIKPSNFDSNKKYPVAYLIHGGPQGSWLDAWSTRWNPAVFAEQGYIVITPNPTGSTGYGQKFTDSIRRNWGGDPYKDIVNVFEWVGKNVPQADNDRAVALGASYGGYMMNWIQGHDLGRKFKCLVCHDGITTFAGSMLGTDELYFPFHDLGGTPWYDPNFDAGKNKKGAAAQAQSNFGAATLSDWRQWDPSEHFANWSTPELVIHSSKDYRLPVAEGLAAFNVLQIRGVESEFLHFPDENHWVLKPENSLVWHKVVLNWINKYAGLPPFTNEDRDSDEFWGGPRQEGEEAVEIMAQGQPST